MIRRKPSEAEEMANVGKLRSSLRNARKRGDALKLERDQACERNREMKAKLEELEACNKELAEQKRELESKLHKVEDWLLDLTTSLGFPLELTDEQKAEPWIDWRPTPEQSKALGRQSLDRLQQLQVLLRKMLTTSTPYGAEEIRCRLRRSQWESLANWISYAQNPPNPPKQSDSVFRSKRKIRKDST